MRKRRREIWEGRSRGGGRGGWKEEVRRKYEGGQKRKGLGE